MLLARFDYTFTQARLPDQTSRTTRRQYRTPQCADSSSKIASFTLRNSLGGNSAPSDLSRGITREVLRRMSNKPSNFGDDFKATSRRRGLLSFAKQEQAWCLKFGHLGPLLGVTDRRWPEPDCLHCVAEPARQGVHCKPRCRLMRGAAPRRPDRRSAGTIVDTSNTDDRASRSVYRSGRGSSRRDARDRRIERISCTGRLNGWTMCHRSSIM